MGSNPNQRLPSYQNDLPISNIASSSSSTPINTNSKKKWSNFVPIFVILIVIAEIAFLGRLDMTKNAALFADKFYQFTRTTYDDDGVSGSGLDLGSGEGSCEEWLEREDYVHYERDFQRDPILVHGSAEEVKSCAVGCKFGHDQNKKADAVFGTPQETGPDSVLRSMESSLYYSENNIDFARRWGRTSLHCDLWVMDSSFGNSRSGNRGHIAYIRPSDDPAMREALRARSSIYIVVSSERRGYKIVMTTSLSSDVPVGYFSWAEYDIMAPPQPKTEKALAAAFISNCAARNFRLQALEALEKVNIKIDSYGGCHHNRDGHVDKVEALKHYKFSLAFENSNEEDYVTEKFFQSLVAGSVPIVVGAPNIQDFAPAPGSILHIKELKDAVSVAKTMKNLAENADAYNQTLRWKFEGPSDSFKALVDMAAVHSSCRLCIHLATTIREKEEKSSQKRPCKCTRGLETVYHFYVRERGRFEMQSIFLRSSDLTLKALESAVVSKYKSSKHVPIWKPERPESIRGGDELKVYRIYPLGKTQREALYTFRFQGDAEFKSHVENNPCANFEVIFV